MNLIPGFIGLALLVSLPIVPAAAQSAGGPRTPILPSASPYSIRAFDVLEQLERERILERQCEAENCSKPALGVVLAPDPTSGARIAAVTPNGAAAAAGLRSGDRLLSVDSHALLGNNGAFRVNNARKLLANLKTDTAVQIGYERDGRRHTVDITPELSAGVVVWIDDSGQEIRARGDFVILSREDLRTLETAKGSGSLPSTVAPRIQREVLQLGPGGNCQGNGCASPALLEAFRWNGLNLALVDPKLGQYFGTNSGVLVISAGPELAALQPGDVIRKIGGTSVATPREAMSALRAKPAGSQVTLELLRNRKPTTARIRIPEAMPQLPPLPPAPTASPSTMLKPALTSPNASMIAFAPPAPPPASSVLPKPPKPVEAN